MKLTAVITEGENTKNSLVDYALQQQGKSKYQGREVWCVSDIKPDEAATQVEDFNSAVEKAEAAGLKVAWSNDAFELWFLLHYQTMDSNLSRHEIYNILKPIWKLDSFHKEAKRKEYCKGHYKDGADQALSIRRAKKLHEAYSKDRNYAKQPPCTTVYLLVEELNKNIKP